MKHKNYILPTGKQVDVYDDIIPMDLRDKTLALSAAANFKLGWGDAPNIETITKDKFLHAELNTQEILTIGLLKYIRESAAGEKIKDLNLLKYVINMTNSQDSNFPHVHANAKKFLIYYANNLWFPHWYGETLFFSEDLNEIDLALTCVPGRIVIADGDIPHCARPQSAAADTYRFVHAMIFG